MLPDCTFFNLPLRTNVNVQWLKWGKGLGHESQFILEEFIRFFQSSPLHSQNPLKIWLIWWVLHMGILTLLGQLVKILALLFYCWTLFRVWGADGAFWKFHYNFPFSLESALPGLYPSPPFTTYQLEATWQVYINVGTVLHAGLPNFFRIHLISVIQC